MEKLPALSKNQLRLSTDKQKLSLLFSPVQEDVSAADIINLIKDSEYKNFKLYKNGIMQAMQIFQDINSGVIDNPESVSVIIAERCDAELSITFDPLKITAKAQIVSAFAGEDVTEEQLMATLHQLNIKVGILDSAIKLLLDKSAQAPAGTSYQITIAKGIPPIDGHDAYFCALLKPPKKQLVHSITEEYGSVDMSHVEQMITVQPGTELIRKIPHIAGEDGLTVTGEVITHTAGKDIPFYIGENTGICESDPNLLVSTVYGTPVALDLGMKVEAALIVEQMAKGSPPIHHDGTLIIKGDVPPGSCITATGDITVIGSIESSAVKCSGDLFISKGILGERTSKDLNESTSKIECAGSIYANFIQYSIIKVGQDLNLQYQLIHSNVFCNGYINVKNKEQQKGAIFGGYLFSKKGIRTVTLGACSDVKTTIDLNGYYLELLASKKRLHLLLEQTREKLQHVLTAQRKLSTLEDSEKTIQLNKRLALTAKEIKNQLPSLENKIKDNQNKIQHCLINTDVIALKTMYSSVSVTIGNEVFRATQKYGATTIHIKNHKLIAESYRR